MHSLVIESFGPIDKFEMTLDKNFNIFIGQQAVGKSTVAKIIYFCEAVKDELYNFLLDEKKLSENDNLLRAFTTILANRFTSYFADTKNNREFLIAFSYDADKSLKIYGGNGKNRQIRFNDILRDSIYNIIINYKNYYSNVNASDALTTMNINEIRRRDLAAEIQNIFCSENYMSLFIPASRYWTTMNSSWIENKNEGIDYLSQKYSNYVNIIKKGFKYNLETVAQTEHLFNDVNDNVINNASKIIRNVLKGDYFYNDFSEMIKYGSGENDYVALSQASSGQQETLWILLSIYDLIIRNRKVMLVIEEPEAHIYPESQLLIVELIAMLINQTDSTVIITTHSPYILTSSNLLIHSAKVEKATNNNSFVISKEMRLYSVAAYEFVRENGFCYQNIIEDEYGMIRAEEIDKISDIISEITDKLIDLEAGN